MRVFIVLLFPQPRTRGWDAIIISRLYFEIVFNTAEFRLQATPLQVKLRSNLSLFFRQCNCFVIVFHCEVPRHHQRNTSTSRDCHRRDTLPSSLPGS